MPVENQLAFYGCFLRHFNKELIDSSSQNTIGQNTEMYMKIKRC